jgi:hypothetical protein
MKAENNKLNHRWTQMHTDKTAAWLWGLTSLLAPVRLKAEIRVDRCSSVVDVFCRRSPKRSATLGAFPFCLAFARALCFIKRT